MGLYDQFLTELVQRCTNPAGGGTAARVKHATYHLYVDAEAAREGTARKATVSERKHQSSLGGSIRRNDDIMLAWAPGTRHRDRVATRRRIYDATGNGHIKGVGGFRKSFVLIGARSEAFRQITKRDNNLVRAVALHSCWIYKSHDVPLTDPT